MNTRRSLIVVSISLALSLLNLSFAASRGTPPQKRRIVLTARVTDEGGGLVSGAHVAVFQGEQHLGAQETDARGMAQIDITLNADIPVELVLEVSKRDMLTTQHKMKLGISFPARLPLEEIELKGGAARADTVLGIKVVDNDRREVSGALVEIDQGQVQVGRANTNAEGVAQIQISAKPNEPLSIRASKMGLQPGASTINLGANVPQHFPQQQIVLEPGIARDIFLAVQVMDEKGVAIPTARVNIYVGMHTGDWVVRAPDYQQDTGASGLVRFTIPMRVGTAPSVTYEVSREDKDTIRNVIDVGPNSPSHLPIEKVILKARLSGEDGGTSVKVKVTDDKGNPLEGALVSSQPPGTGITKKQQSVTGPDGYAILRMPLWSADNYEKFTLEVSKPGYQDNKGGIEINNKENRANGKTFDAKPISLLKLAGNIFVKITVLDGDTNNGVPGAEVILDGPQYATGTTNTSGVAPLAVDHPGTYKVRISQDTYWPVKDAEIHIVAGRPPDPEPIRLRPKPTKDAAEDSIDITVLAKDSLDDKDPHPLKGAAVTDGRGTSYTDERGQVTLRGAFDRAQDISVSANDYKSATKRVTVAKSSLLGNATGKTTVVLEPALNEKVAIRLVVEVRDDQEPHNLIENAHAYLWLNNKNIASERAAAGEATFTLKDTVELPLAKLRSGLKVFAKAPGYELRDSEVAAKLLEPSLETARATIFLKKTTVADKLRRSLDPFEAKVKAWQASAPSGPADLQRFADKAADELKDARALADKSDAAAKSLSELTMIDGESLCAKTAKLQLAIRNAQLHVSNTEAEIDKSLKEATARAARCATAAEAESLRATYRQAIKDVGEIGKLRTDALRNQQELSQLVTKSTDAQGAQTRLKESATQLTTLALAARQNESDAKVRVGRLNERRDASVTTQNLLKDEFNKMTTGLDATNAPGDVMQRVKILRESLGISILVPAVPPIIGSAPAEIEKLQTSADARVEQFERKVCKVTKLDDAIEDIKTKVDAAGLDVGFANDLPALADACIAKAASKNKVPTTNPNTGDNINGGITVGNDPGDKPVFEPPIKDKTDKSNTPLPTDKTTTTADQDAGSGGFWDAAKAGKRDVENKVGNKPAKPTKPATTGGNTNSVTNRSGTRPPNSVSDTDEKSADKPNTVTSKSGNNQTDSSSTREGSTDKRGTNTTGNKTSNQTKPATGTEDSGANSTTNKTTAKTNNPEITVEEIPEERVRSSTAANQPINRQGNSAAKEDPRDRTRTTSSTTVGGVANKADGGKGTDGGRDAGNRGAVSPPTNKPPPGNGGDADGRQICERLPQEIRAQFASPSGKLLPINQGIAGGPACRGDLNAGEPQYLSFFVEKAVQFSPRELVQTNLAQGGTSVAGLGELSSEEDYRGERIVYIIRVARGPYYLSVEGLPASKARLRQLAQQLDTALKSWSRPR